MTQILALQQLPSVKQNQDGLRGNSSISFALCA